VATSPKCTKEVRREKGYGGGFRRRHKYVRGREFAEGGQNRGG